MGILKPISDTGDYVSIVEQVRLYARAAAPCAGHWTLGAGQFKAIVEPHDSGTGNRNYNLVLYEGCEPTYK